MYTCLLLLLTSSITHNVINKHLINLSGELHFLLKDEFLTTAIIFLLYQEM